MTNLPIRLRLTLWYSVMFATAALMLSSTSWWMLRHAINATTRQDLQERIDDVRMQLQQFGPQLSQAEAQQRFDAIYHYRDDGKWLQIVDQNGGWVYRSARMTSLPAAMPLPRAIPSGGDITEFIQGSRHIRALTSTINVDGRSYSVETGAAMNKQNVLLRHFGLGLLLLTPVVLIAAILAGHIMSRKALKPVALIAAEARRINDKNLDQRLPVPATNDELSDLSVTLNNMLARIDDGFRSVRDFTANASHELRTPLARLRTEIEIALLRPRSAREYSEILLHMEETTIDMTTLIDSLLALARAEARSDGCPLSAVNLGSIIHSIVEEWDGVTAHLGITLSSEGAELADTDPLLVLGNATSLQRLLRIWMDNACKFTPRGGSISLIAESEGDTVFLGLQDTGTGIPLDEQERIFERFYRVEGDEGKQQRGSGLGLSLANWIATEHNSTISVDSAPGKGSRFQISLVRIHTGSRSPTAVERRTSRLTPQVEPHPTS
jgi:heavy metal sensor kinase